MLRLAALISLLVLAAPEALAQTPTLPSCANYAYGGFNSDACRAERAQMRADGDRLHRETMEARRLAAEAQDARRAEDARLRRDAEEARESRIYAASLEHQRRMREDPAYRENQERIAAERAAEQRQTRWYNSVRFDSQTGSVVFSNGARWVRPDGVSGHNASAVPGRWPFRVPMHERLAGEGAYVRADGTFAGCGFFSAAWDGFGIPEPEWAAYLESQVRFSIGRDLPAERSQDILPATLAARGAIEFSPTDRHYYRVRLGPGGAQWHGIPGRIEGDLRTPYTNLDDLRIAEYQGTLYAPSGESLGPAGPNDPRLFDLRPAASAAECTRPLPVRVIAEADLIAIAKHEGAPSNFHVWVSLPDVAGARPGRGVGVSERNVIAGHLSAAGTLDGPAIAFESTLTTRYSASQDAYNAGTIPWRIKRRTYVAGIPTGLEVDDAYAGFHSERFVEGDRYVGPSEVTFDNAAAIWEGTCDGPRCRGTYRWPSGGEETGWYRPNLQRFAVRSNPVGQTPTCRLHVSSGPEIVLASPAPDTCQGCLAGDCQSGTGTRVEPDGNVYIGEFRDGQAHGDGRLYSIDDSGYDGEWRQGKQHGEGTFTCPNPRLTWIGEWRDGEGRRGHWYSALTNGVTEKKRRSRFDAAFCG